MFAATQKLNLRSSLLLDFDRCSSDFYFHLQAKKNQEGDSAAHLDFGYYDGEGVARDECQAVLLHLYDVGEGASEQGAIYD